MTEMHGEVKRQWRQSAKHNGNDIEKSFQGQFKPNLVGVIQGHC